MSQQTVSLFAVLVLLFIGAVFGFELRGIKQPTTVKSQPAMIQLNKYNIAPDSTSVSGVSAGGFFAVQFQVAYR